MSELSDQLWALVRAAKKADAEAAKRSGGYNYADNVNDVHADVFAYFNVMFKALPEDDFLKTYIPEKLKELEDEIGQKAVMAKLESENG
jgi:hypothetical protein